MREETIKLIGGSYDDHSNRKLVLVQPPPAYFDHQELFALKWFIYVTYSDSATSHSVAKTLIGKLILCKVISCTSRQRRSI